MINYVKGDATEPLKTTPNANCLIVHCCNDIGAWGAGFVLELSEKWNLPEKHYIKHRNQLILGDIQIVKVEKNICVINLIGQHGIRNLFNPEPIDYKALKQGLSKINHLILKSKSEKEVTVHMPKIECGLAGGKWEIVEKIIEQCFSPSISVFVYEKE